MLNRRNVLQGMAAGAGAAFGLSLDSKRLLASPTGNGTPKRVIFFMQNQGFDPETCIPEGMKTSYNKDLEFHQEMQGIARIITEERSLLMRIMEKIRAAFEE